MPQSRLLLLIFLGLLPTAGSAQEVTKRLGFDPPGLKTDGGGTSFRPNLLEQGFIMGTPGDGMYISGAESSLSSSNGSNYARFIYGQENFTVVHKDGLPFTPLRVDLAEYGIYTTGTVTFQGRKANGSTVTVTWTLDGIKDGTGPLADFETFVFPASFAQIVELKSPGTIYCLDNLEVTVYGTESPDPPEAVPPLVYDIDWNDAPHAVNQPTATGGSHAPSSSIFGTQYVRSKIGPLTNRPLELSATEDMYDQFGLWAGMSAGRYVLEFDMTQIGSNSLALFLDHTQGFLRTDFYSSGSIEYLNYDIKGGVVGNNTNGTYAPRAVTHFRFDFDIAVGRIELAVDGTPQATWTIPPGGGIDLKTVRFSVPGTDVIGVDNVKFSAYDRSAVVAIPGTYDFQQINVGSSATMPLSLLNSGTSPVTITGASPTSSIFGLVNATFPVVIQAGESALFTMRAQPIAAGYASQAIDFTTSDGRVLVIGRVQGVASTPASGFTRHPASALVAVGGSVSLSAAVSGSVSRYEWTKDGVVQPGATSATLSLSPAKLGSAGVYRMRAVLTTGATLTSNPAQVSVVAPLISSLDADPGTLLDMQAQATGSGITIVWRQDNLLLRGTEPGVQIDGAKLTLNPVQRSHEGLYTADVLMTDEFNGLVHVLQAVRLTLTVQQPPRITSKVLPQWLVGLPGTTSVQMTRSGTVFATGLPPGLILNSQTGVISGTPTAAATPQGVSTLYAVTLWAENEYGVGEAVTLDCWVHPVRAGVNLAGMVKPGLLYSDSRQLGGIIHLTVTKAGLFSGTVRMAYSTVVVTGALSFRPVDGTMAGVLNLKSSPSLVQQIRVRMDVLLQLGSEDEDRVADGMLTALPMVSRPDPVQHVPGLYPTALLAAAPQDLLGAEVGLDSPGGVGYLQARLLASGRLTYTGQLADGTAITGNEELVANVADRSKVRIPLFTPAPVGRGSLVGWLICGQGFMDGQLTWKKGAAAADKSYPQGFTNVTLDAVGDLNRAAPANHVTLLKLAKSKPSVLFSGAGLIGTLEKHFSVSKTLVATSMDTPPAALSLQAADGIFRGTVNTAMYRGAPVRASFQGVLVPRLGLGVGFFLNPDMRVFRGYAYPMRYLSGPVFLEPEVEE